MMVACKVSQISLAAVVSSITILVVKESTVIDADNSILSNKKKLG
jgi:hypothetical protein